MPEEAVPPDAALSLLLAPALSPAGERACFAHRRDGERPPDRSIAVLLTDRPEVRVRGWEDHAEGVPAEAVVLATQRPAEEPDRIEVSPLDAPGDLSALGVAITERLQAWPPTGRSTFCFDSVTGLLQFVSTDEAVRFFETLHPHLAEAGVVGHLHLNPGAHDEATVSRFEEVVDDVVTIDDEAAGFLRGDS